MGVAVDLCQKTLQNKHASMPFIVPILVLANTPTETIEANIRANTARDLPWLKLKEAHQGIAVLCGGGPSLAGDLDAIRKMRAGGGMVFAMNAASQFLRSHGIEPDYQMIVDAKPETAHLVDTDAKAHLIASQCDPATLSRAERATLWHVHSDGIENLFPPEKVKAGGYVLTGGGISVGNCALTVAYALGFRTMHCFGYDSSHSEGQSHAYSQPMNQFIPNVDIEWGRRTYTCSVAMKAQAEKFQLAARQFEAVGCTIEVHGDGLLPAMWNTKADKLTERDKYRLMWRTDTYRAYSPGEYSVNRVMGFAKPPGPVIDFGCGTGRASLLLKRAGYNVTLVDFADNCRDPEAMSLPFIEWDLTKPDIPARAPYGICADVMEHIPTKDVAKVIRNVMSSAGMVLFQISTVDDNCGALLGATLHNTVRPHAWWGRKFVDLGFQIDWQDHNDIQSRFIVFAPSQKG